MFNIFNKKKIWDKFSLKSKNFLDIILTIISIDDNILWVHIYDNYIGEDIMSHIPIFLKDFSRSNITYIWKEKDIEEFSLSWYNHWRSEKWGVFNIKIEDLLDSFPVNRMVFLREDNKELRDYSFMKNSWISTKAVFWNDGKIEWLYPLYKRVLYPQIWTPAWDLVINEFNFIELWNIHIDKHNIRIWYYDYSIAIRWQFDLEMFNFSYTDIPENLYWILRIIKILETELLSFEPWVNIWLNDFSITFDTDNNNYIFQRFSDSYILSKESAEWLLIQYKILLNNYIKEKEIIINLNNNKT